MSNADEFVAKYNTLFTAAAELRTTLDQAYAPARQAESTYRQARNPTLTEIAAHAVQVINSSVFAADSITNEIGIYHAMAQQVPTMTVDADIVAVVDGVAVAIGTVKGNPAAWIEAEVAPAKTRLGETCPALAPALERARDVARAMMQALGDLKTACTEYKATLGAAGG